MKFNWLLLSSLNNIMHRICVSDCGILNCWWGNQHISMPSSTTRVSWLHLGLPYHAVNNCIFVCWRYIYMHLEQCTHHYPHIYIYTHTHTHTHTKYMYLNGKYQPVVSWFFFQHAWASLLDRIQNIKYRLIYSLKKANLNWQVQQKRKIKDEKRWP